jgi:hypothetical protein
LIARLKCISNFENNCDRIEINISSNSTYDVEDISQKITIIKHFITQNETLNKVCVDEYTGRRRRLSMLQREELTDFFEKKFKELLPMILELELSIKRTKKSAKETNTKTEQ